MNPREHNYSDDIFAETRMSFGDHLEELRWRMWAALKGLLFFMIVGFILDGIGTATKWKNFGVGKPALEMIKAPVEDQMNVFYDTRAWKAQDDLMGEPKTSEERAQREEEKRKFMEDCTRLRIAGSLALDQATSIKLNLKRDDLAASLETSNEEYVPVRAKIHPIELASALRLANEQIGKRNQLTTLSAQEMFVVYFKVTLLCGIVLSSPWIFYQFWAFVGAGLYPHEKRHVHIYLPFSIFLFLAGVLLCFIWVLPSAVRALLAFNEWLGVDPDIRLNEWLSLAIILPLVFGISFQTPLVMLFMNRLGMFTWEDYLSKWRYAIIIMAAFSAIITPTPDAVTMLYLFIPMFGLYMLGILLCKWMPPPDWDDEESGVNDEEVAV